MKLMKRYVDKKGTIRDLPKSVNRTYDILTVMCRYPDMLAGLKINIPEGYIQFKKGISGTKMEFSIDMTEDRMGVFRKSFSEIMEMVREYEIGPHFKAYFMKEIDIDGNVAEYLVHVKGNRLVLEFPKRVMRKLKPNNIADGYALRELRSPFYNIGLDNAFYIAAAVIDDATENFGFESVDIEGPARD